MTNFLQKMAAGTQMFMETRQKLYEPELESTEKLIEVPRRFTSKMRTLRLTLRLKFEVEDNIRVIIYQLELKDHKG